MHRSSLSIYHCRNYVLWYSADPLLSTRVSCCGKVAILHLLFLQIEGMTVPSLADAYDSSIQHLSLALDSRTAPIIIWLILLSWPFCIGIKLYLGQTESMTCSVKASQLLGWRMSLFYQRYIKTPTHTLTKLSKHFVSTSKASIQLYPATCPRHKTLNTPWLNIAI